MALTEEAKIRERQIKSDYETNKQTLTARQKFAKFYNGFFKNMSSIRQILLWYLIISLTGALLLWLPFTHTEGLKTFGDVSFIDSLFISSSAFSDTGLSTVGISETFNFFGQLVTLILLSIGGVGWFTIKIFILQYIFRRKTSYKAIADAASEVGTVRKSETLGLVFSAVIISVSATVIFGFIFSFIFCFTPAINAYGVDTANLSGEYVNSLWAGLYHASASVNNSGLDVFNGNGSLDVYYQGANGVIVQILTIMLFVVGGIGFGVFYDVWTWLRYKATGKRFAFSLITKISVITYAIVAITGLGLAYMFETINYFTASSDVNTFVESQGTASQGYAWWAITFNTFSTRNAGFSTVDISTFSESTKILFSIMMFIGSGPGSTAGGLRTTTVAVLLIAAWSEIRGRKTYNTLNRDIPRDTVKQAIGIFIASLGLVTVWILVIGITEAFNQGNEIGLIDDVFVVFSAFGTTGLSTADSLEDFHWFSKLMLIILMFLGQLGMSTTLSQFKSKKLRYQKDFVQENINLG